MPVSASVRVRAFFCQHCAKPVGSIASFCTTCGAKINGGHILSGSNDGNSQSDIAALTKMVVEHPDDKSYRRLLALHLYDDAFKDWWKDPETETRYCVSLDQVQHARYQLTAALEIQFDDPKLREQLITELLVVNLMEQRKYASNWFMMILLGLFHIIPGVLWWYVNRRPQYLINRDYVSYRQTGRHRNPALKMGGMLGQIGEWVEQNTGGWGGWIAFFVMCVLGVLLSPLFMILAYKQNYLDVGDPPLNSMPPVPSFQPEPPPRFVSTKLKCPRCHREWAADARFCTACGEMLHRKCVKCLSPLSPNMRFCISCGSSTFITNNSSAEVCGTLRSGVSLVTTSAVEACESDDQDARPMCSNCKHRKPKWICGSASSPHHLQHIDASTSCGSFLLNPAQIHSTNGLKKLLIDEKEAAEAELKVALELGLPQDNEMTTRFFLGGLYVDLIVARGRSWQDYVNSPQFPEAMKLMEEALQLDRDGGYNYFAQPLNRSRLNRLDGIYRLAAEAMQQRQSRTDVITFLQKKLGLCAYLPSCPLLHVLHTLGELCIHENQREIAQIYLRDLINSDPVDLGDGNGKESRLRQKAHELIETIL